MSVNAGISEDLASITYAHVDDAVEYIKTLGVGTLLIKVDLENAYRHISIHPEDHHLLGISWEGRTYVDLSHLVCALPPRYSLQLQT